MGTFLSILLDILAILVIIIVGSLVVVLIAELILHLFDNGRRRDKEKDEVARVVNDNDIVVYSNSNPNETNVVNSKVENTVDGDKIQEIDYDKAMEEQRMIQSKKGGSVSTPAPAPRQQSKPVEKAPSNNDMFLDAEDDEEFQRLLDSVIKEAKDGGRVKKSTSKVEDTQGFADEKDAPKAAGLDAESKKELEEIKALAKQQQKELEEFKKMQESNNKGDNKPAKRELDDETKREIAELKELREKQQQELDELKAFQKAQQQKEIDEMNARKEQQRQQELEDIRELQRQQQKELEEFKKMQEEKANAKADEKPTKKELDEETKKELEELRALKERQQQELDELKAEQKAQKQKEIDEMNARKEQQRQQEIDELKALKEQQQREIEELKAQQAEQQRAFEEYKNRQEEPVVVVEETVEEKDNEINEQTQRELEELRALKEQQREEIEEFKQMKEDFAKEKEEQLELLKANLEKAKEEEIEKIRQELLKEQEKLEQLQDQLEQERQQWEDEKAKITEAEETETPATIMYDIDGDGEEDEVKEPIVQETIIKDEEELNRLKYKNLMRMNNRLTRIIRDTERLQIQKQKEVVKNEEEKRKLLAKQEQERIREQEKMNELARQEQERVRKEQEAIEKKTVIERKLQEASKRAGKYQLDSKVVKITRERKGLVNSQEPIEERVVEPVQPVVTADVAPMKATARPVFDKEYYENRLVELEEELKDAEKELRANKAEYIPLTRIHKAYVRDGEKLRKKEMQVAKQKVALYGVNSKNVDPAKKEKLDENLQALAELKDSVLHCEEIIKKNKDRYPVIEKNYNLINKHIQRINDDMKVCRKALDYYNKKSK